jgi:hypothetical protein
MASKLNPSRIKRMPAYARVSLVTPVFHPSDIAFVRGWSAAAPGLCGWQVSFDQEDAPEQVSVAPPGAEEPLFVITRAVREVVVYRRRPSRGGELEELQRFDGLREAVLALAPLTDDALETIHETLERDFPRRGR